MRCSFLEQLNDSPQGAPSAVKTLCKSPWTMRKKSTKGAPSAVKTLCKSPRTMRKKSPKGAPSAVKTLCKPHRTTGRDIFLKRNDSPKGAPSAVKPLCKSPRTMRKKSPKGAPSAVKPLCKAPIHVCTHLLGGRDHDYIHGLVVNCLALEWGDPGSIPGRGKHFFSPKIFFIRSVFF